ncbi:MAG: hypothetical protein A3F54_03860 [Candidatus Kerfeldbacteria bacterium RIFCSPHIGHO2_12_FULL_48_17]|uniref:ABC3 transporter permease protein domain-containing protein n=1 Tax=Candidatus Kerfeldbacteria bacterium RIFCSPHIGHO2_12_FULL_48_17 TaxID=1798542 RepID=A0A1G2B7R6_9BACT|nr:MAG: hypothetical protein A3F54_03860 [Candidatus Kerfeldbacteria bacterium RIFCSPHIGHO2_12_FULL_48_17]
MKLNYIIKLATANLRDRKLRSALTIGGMIVAISMIVFLVSLGFGLQRLITDRIANVEALTILDVTTGTSALLRMNESTIAPFYKMEHVAQVSPSANLSSKISYNNTVTDTAVFAINPNFITLEGVKIIWGENFPADSNNMAVLSTTAVELLGVSDFKEMVGKTIDFDFSVPVIDGRTGEQTGETETKRVPTSITGVVDDELAIAYVPLNLVSQFAIANYDLVRVKTDSQSNLNGVRSQIEDLGFQVDSVADTVGQVDRIFFVFQIIMASLGFIATFVASLGTFNTLTVSLLERTREIGIMKSLGARKTDIYKLFLAESLVIGLLGSLLGTVFGFILGEVTNFGVNVLAASFGGEAVDVFRTPLLFLILVFSFVFLVSLVTGLYPARRAANTDPLDAIRYE